jgi:hypothetical protein
MVPLDNSNQQQHHHPIVWTWTNSLLFAIAVISQIGENIDEITFWMSAFPHFSSFSGYGYLFPLASLGKMLLMPFAMVGLPLFLVTISDLGRFIAELLNATYRIVWKFYRKCHCHYAMQPKMRRNSEATTISCCCRHKHVLSSFILKICVIE